MSLKLAKNNTSPYDYYSEGDGSDPVTVSVTLDNSGGTSDTNVVTAYLVATDYNYTGITVTTQNEETGIDWKLSLDNSTWADSINPADMDATSGDQTTPVYLKAVVNNDGTVATGNYTQADVKITATENPA